MLRGKFGPDPGALAFLGYLLAEACSDLPLPDAIVPVPLHPTRLKERGFNQCQELARPLARKLGVPIQSDWLQRQIPTSHQVGLSRAQRRANLDNAFAASPAVKGKRILLIDDTLTTGTTLRKAAQHLLTASTGRARAVDVAVVARTPKNKSRDCG